METMLEHLQVLIRLDNISSFVLSNDEYLANFSNALQVRFSKGLKL